MPDEADAPVALGPNGLDRSLHGVPHGMELVIGRNLLRDLSLLVLLEHDEVAQVVDEAALLEDAPEERRHLRRPLGRDVFVVHAAPGLKPLATRADGAHAGVEPVRDDEHGVEAQQIRDLLRVRLQLLMRLPDVRLLVGGVLQLEEPDRQAVHVNHDVRPPLLVAPHRELVHGSEVVRPRLLEVHQPDQLAPDATLPVRRLHFHALHEEVVDRAVREDERRRGLPQHLVECFFTRCRRGFPVQPIDRVAQAPGQEDFVEGGPLLARFAGTNLGTMNNLVAKFLEEIERSVLDDGFGESVGHCCPLPRCREGRTIRDLS